MKSDEKEYDLTILGHIAKDIIITDGKTEEAIGGAVYYGAIAGSHMGLKIHVITRLRKEDELILSDFKKNGISVSFSFSEQTSGIKNIYETKNMEVRTCKPLGFAGLFQESDIPKYKTKYFILGPILAGEIDLKLLNILADRYAGKLCMDIQGFVRVSDLKNDRIFFCNLSDEDKHAILKHITILKVDRAEAEALTGISDLEKAGEELISYGPREILITHEKGISVKTQKNYHCFPWRYSKLIGRTGRGDTAFVSYIGSRINKNEMDSLKFATALTSLKLESPGPFRLPLHQVQTFMNKQL